ncbi:unnamed protein product [Sphenostylis stenocarpa]|uniref:Uncharacterized protein n=1 Tax=Sphenostylis stenocarpa TaxID=92480 RepID=A0AA86VPH6_9FABA|nr:unnamed protein product [Sphenostylis stenocarpa]
MEIRVAAPMAMSFDVDGLSSSGNSCEDEVLESIVFKAGVNPQVIDSSFCG